MTPNLRKSFIPTSMCSETNQAPLELLGDAVLGFLVSLDVFLLEQTNDEKMMSETRRGRTNNASLGERADSINIMDVMVDLPK